MLLAKVRLIVFFGCFFFNEQKFALNLSRSLFALVVNSCRDYPSRMVARVYETLPADYSLLKQLNFLF